MSNAACNENWHIFLGGLPKEGAVCKCGTKRATATAGVLEDVNLIPPKDGAAEPIQQLCKICQKPIKLDEMTEKMLSFFGDVGGAHEECLGTQKSEMRNHE